VLQNKRPYRIVSISLYTDEATEADRVTEILRDAGWPKANRSLVMREALSRLLEDLAAKEPEDIFQYFLNRRAKGTNKSGKRP
jgi:Lon protease-like protein